MSISKRKGIIIVGYYGIDTILNNPRDINSLIKLDDLYFMNNGDYIEDWHKIYCAQAVSLAKQGCVVLISPHKNVQNELRKYLPNEDFIVVSIAPASYLKKDWTDALHRIWTESKLERDHINYLEAVTNYELDVPRLITCSVFTSFIVYDLECSFRKIIQAIKQVYLHSTNNTIFKQIISLDD